ncbi:MAG: PAS domain S-box protein [Bacteroidetes bacterium]|nr:PAS domain S-box protein [Bacteroidota bacterium]
MYKIFEYAPDAILLIDSQGRIAKVNVQFEKMFGYRRDEIIGQFVEALIPQRFSKRHLGFRSSYMASPHMRPMGFGLELLGKRKDDSEFPVDIMLSPLSANGDRLVLAVIRDATERRRVEAQAQEAGEMYIKEIHHRVKNNLQVISSLLFLQSTYLTDANILNILKESQSRVKSIALIHEKLYRSTDLSKLDFSEYVHDLVMNLFRTYGVNQEGIAVRTHVQNVRLEVDTAIPCGLIINELVSNVLKHAFPNESGGEVIVELGPTLPGEFLLTVRDNGVGLPEGFDWRASSSLGLKLVMDLTRQLDGKVEVHVDNGTVFRITFRELHYKERR